MPKVVQGSPFNITLSSNFTVASRLLRADGFDRVIRAESVSDKYFKIFYANNGENNGRLGIIASKKTLPKAVDRNRAKRIIRETFRRHNIKFCNFDLVVMVRRDYSQKAVTQTVNLGMLFSQVEHKCAE